MKNAYINNVSVRHGEISVVTSAHTGGTIKSITQIQNSIHALLSSKRHEICKNHHHLL